MAVTLTYSPRNYRGSTSDTDAPGYPEELRIKDAVQTALTAGFGANAGTVKAAEDRLDTIEALVANGGTLDLRVDALEADATTLSTSFALRVPISLTANSTWSTYHFVPTACTVTAIGLITPTVFASTGGTVLLTVKKTNSAGNTMLVAATYDLEAASADARVNLSLTATGADLGLAAHGPIYIAVVSNNADATGPAESAAALVFYYTPTI